MVLLWEKTASALTQNAVFHFSSLSSWQIGQVSYNLLNWAQSGKTQGENTPLSSYPALFTVHMTQQQQVPSPQIHDSMESPAVGGSSLACLCWRLHPEKWLNVVVSATTPILHGCPIPEHQRTNMLGCVLHFRVHGCLTSNQTKAYQTIMQVTHQGKSSSLSVMQVYVNTV